MKKTEVTPAMPPQMRRVTGDKSAPGCDSKIFWLVISAILLTVNFQSPTYPLVKIIATELHSRVGDDADAVSAIPAHKPSPALLFPHLSQSLPDGKLVRISSSALDLHEDFESLEG